MLASRDCQTDFLQNLHDFKNHTFSFLLLFGYQQVSPVQSLHESSSDRSNSKTINKNISVATKSIRTLKSRNTGTPKKGEVPLDPAALFSAVLNRTRTEDKIQWSSLPSSLMKLGKVLRFRNVCKVIWFIFFK